MRCPLTKEGHRTSKRPRRLRKLQHRTQESKQPNKNQCTTTTSTNRRRTSHRDQKHARCLPKDCLGHIGEGAWVCVGGRGTVVGGIPVGNVVAPVLAPVGPSRAIGLRILHRRVRHLVRNNIRNVFPVNAGNRTCTLSFSRGLTVVRAYISRIGNHIPICTNANYVAAHRAVRLDGHTTSLNTSVLSVVAPDFTITSRGRVCSRCIRITGRISIPVILCGVPTHANGGLLPRAITGLTGSISIVVNTGSSDNS